MAAETQLPNGSWTAFSAEKILEILDDELKGHHARFSWQPRCSRQTSSRMSMAFPTTHYFEGCKLIAKYPVDQWEAAGAEYFSARGWRLLTMRVAKQDYSNLEKVFETANKALAKCPQDGTQGGQRAESGSTGPEPLVSS